MTRLRFNRIVAWQVLIVSLVLTILAGAGIFVWLRHQQYQAGLAELEPRYARLLGLLKHQTDLQALGTQVSAAMVQRSYPASQDIAKAGNDAQQRIRSLFADSRLEVISIQVLPAKEEGQFNRITITLRVEGDLSAMQTALDKLTGLTPTVLVDSMTLQTIGAVRPASVQRLGGQFSFSVFRLRA